jgi:glucokinase
MRAFTNKGRLTPLLEATPVRIIRHDRTGLMGAALWAARCGGRA